MNAIFNFNLFLQISTSVHVLGCVVTATIVVMSIVLFLRILKADFHYGSKNTNTTTTVTKVQ